MKFKLVSLSEGQFTFDWDETRVIIGALLEVAHGAQATSQAPNLVNEKEEAEWLLACAMYKQLHLAGIEDEDYNKLFEKELGL